MSTIDIADMPTTAGFKHPERAPLPLINNTFNDRFALGQTSRKFTWLTTYKHGDQQSDVSVFKSNAKA